MKYNQLVLIRFEENSQTIKYRLGFIFAKCFLKEYAN